MRAAAGSPGNVGVREDFAEARRLDADAQRRARAGDDWPPPLWMPLLIVGCEIAAIIALVAGVWWVAIVVLAGLMLAAAHNVMTFVRLFRNARSRSGWYGVRLGHYLALLVALGRATLAPFVLPLVGIRAHLHGDS